MRTQNYWFDSYSYGAGWFPKNWKGWLTIILFLLVNGINRFYFNFHVLLIAILTIPLILTICYFKGPPLKWRWGKGNNS